jgi:putative membrane protein
MENNIVLAKKLNRWAWIISGVVLALVLVMRRVKIPLPNGVDFSFLPPFHAMVNGVTALILLAAFIAIKNKRVELHRKLVFTALGLSLLFLLSYVAYHFTTPETIYGDFNGDGILEDEERLAVGKDRVVYLALLLSHILLAAFSLPFILLTFIRAYTQQFDAHKKMARWVFPIWFYVAATGPICYLLLLPYYN